MREITQLAGSKVDQWTLEQVLGKGADGIVYAARGEDGRPAAVKLFFPESVRRSGLAETKERLELQLALAGVKHHPNLVEIYGGGDCPEHSTLYIAMELIPGASLDKLAGRVPSASIPNLIKQLAGATRYLEEKLELFHRDIKPANIVVSNDFSTLTLLDLGVVYRLLDGDDARISGPEFVATLRYSPPEFVWRTEEGSEDGAWRAVSFYQIGATLHDLLAGKPLFHGDDQPRARLYDCVRDKTPYIPTEGVEPWLAQLAQACLLKDWRTRLNFVSWDSFEGLSTAHGVSARETAIRLRQARSEEARLAAAKNVATPTPNPRAQTIWRLNSGLFGEVRTYLLDSPIFPKFKATETPISEQEYHSRFEFEKDADKGFPFFWTVEISVLVSALAKEATDLRFAAEKDGSSLFEAKWTEMFTVETAFSNCQQALLDVVDSLLS